MYNSANAKETNQLFYILDGNVNYEEFVTMLLHKKPSSQEDKHSGSANLKRKSDAGSSKSRTGKSSDK